MSIGGICINAYHTAVGAIQATGQWIASTKVAQAVSATALPILSALSSTLKSWAMAFVSLHPLWQLAIGVVTVLGVASVLNAYINATTPESVSHLPADGSSESGQPPA